MKVRATLSLRNDAVISAREKLGMTQVQLAEAIGGSQREVSAIECLRFNHVSEQAIARLAMFLCVEPEAIVPDDLRKKVIPNRYSIVREVDAQALIGIGPRILIENKTAPMEVAEMRAAIGAALDSLTFREREIVKLRYGLDDGHEFTLAEVGRIFRTSPDQVRTIENRAIRKLQRPERARVLARAAFGDDRDDK
jgi:transcriptional regulator with XRE-family HTH domain